MGTIRWDPEGTANDVEKRLRDRFAKVQQRICSKYDSSVGLGLQFDMIRDACEVSEHDDFVQQALRAASFVTVEK